MSKKRIWNKVTESNKPVLFKKLWLSDGIEVMLGHYDSDTEQYNNLLGGYTDPGWWMYLPFPPLPCSDNIKGQ